MIENTHRICPLGDFSADRDTCALPPGWGKEWGWRPDRGERFEVIKKAIPCGDYSTNQNLWLVKRFQFFTYAGRHYIPHLPRKLYAIASQLLIGIPALAACRMVMYTFLFFKSFGVAGYSLGKGIATKDYKALKEASNDIAEQLLGAGRTVLVIAPLMFSVIGIFFAPHQMRLLEARLERWWVQPQPDQDDCCGMLNFSFIRGAFQRGRWRNLKVYAAYCFQPLNTAELRVLNKEIEGKEYHLWIPKALFTRTFGLTKGERASLVTQRLETCAYNI